MKKFYYFLMFVSLFSKYAIAQDKGMAKDYLEPNSELIKRLNELTSGDYNSKEFDSQKMNEFANFGVESKDASSLEDKLEKEKDQLKFYHELPFMGLKGDIESVTITKYAATYDLKKNPIIKKNQAEQPIILSFTKIVFDENGYPSELMETTMKNGVPFTNRKKMRYIGPQLVESVELDEKNVETKLKYIGVKNGFDTYIQSRRGWIDFEVRYSYNTKKNESLMFSLDEKGNKVVEKKDYINNRLGYTEKFASGQITYKAQFKYNDDGTVRRVVQIIVDTKPFVRFYNYTQKDSQKNWTERIFIYPNQIPISIEKAEYNYRYIPEDPTIATEENTETKNPEALLELDNSEQIISVEE